MAAHGSLQRCLALATLLAGLGLAQGACFSPREYPGKPPCSTVADCDDGTPCTLDYCDANGVCQHDNASPPAALLDDGKPCTVDACVAGVEKHTPAAMGAMCGEQQELTCSASGACGMCSVAGQCGNDTPCRKWSCTNGTCAAAPAKAGTACGNLGTCDDNGTCLGCDDKVQDGGETDVDCGGPCAKLTPKLGCAAGQRCDATSDCAANTKCTDGKCCPTAGCPAK